VTGEGSLNDTARTSFAFEVRSTRSGPEGPTKVRTGNHRFTSTSIRTLTVSGRTASWTGTGTWDGNAGFTFTVAIVDGATRESSSSDRSAVTVTPLGTRESESRDRFAITIRSSLGASVFSTDATLRSGNVTIEGNKSRGDSGDSAGTADWADRAAPRLRAIVGGRAIAE
jgi:hypothetical protein